MGIYQIDKITSVEYSAVLSKFSSNLAAEIYKEFPEADSSISLEDWLEANAGEDLWKDLIRNQDKAVFGAFFDNRIVGTIWATKEEGEHNTDSRIGGLYIGAPGQGLATALLNHAEMQLAAWGCKSVFIEVARRSSLRELLSNRQYDALAPPSKAELSPASWVDMRKRLVKSTAPQEIDSLRGMR